MTVQLNNTPSHRAFTILINYDAATLDFGFGKRVFIFQDNSHVQWTSLRLLREFSFSLDIQVPQSIHWRSRIDRQMQARLPQSHELIFTRM